MSFPYRVKLKEAVTTTISDKDSTSQTVVLEKILSDEEMKDIFKDALKDQGFKEQAGNKLVKKHDTGEVETCDLDSLEIVTELEIKKEIKVEETTTVTARRDGDQMSNADRESFKKKAEEDFRAKLEEKAKEKAENMQGTLVGKIGNQLAKSEEKRRDSLIDAIRETYKEALTRKAKSLGSVESIQENGQGDDYQLTITITE